MDDTYDMCDMYDKILRMGRFGSVGIGYSLALEPMRDMIFYFFFCSAVFEKPRTYDCFFSRQLLHLLAYALDEIPH